MLSPFTPTHKGMLIALCGFAAFAGADASAKWLGAHYDTFVIMFWSYLFSLIFGILISPWIGGLKKTLSTKRLPVHIGRGVCGFGIAACVIKAMSMGLPLANMYTILFLAPFFITIVAWPIYKEPVPLKNWLIIALGFCGILVAYPPGYNPITAEELYAFAALIFIVGLSMLARPLDSRESIHSLSFYPALIIICMVVPFIWRDLPIPALKHLHVFIMNGIFVTIGLSGIAYGFRIAPYSLIAPIHYIQMVIAITVGYLVFGDVPTPLMLAGAAIIITSGLLLVFAKKRAHKT